MTNQEPTPEDYLDIADKVRSGEYFREARAMYDLDVHDPMSDRYWFVLLTALSVFVCVMIFSALQSLYPLKREIPFIFPIQDVMEDLPRMKKLAAPGEDANIAIQRFLVSNYVKMREDFDIKTFDRNQGSVQSQSTKEVLGEFLQYVDPRNPQSPVVLYQRKATRVVHPVDVTFHKDGEFGVSVIYDAVVTGLGDGKPTRWQADIAFKYEGIKLNEETNKVKPFAFLVTGYRTKRL